MDGLLQLLGNHLQIGLPHVATDKTDREAGLLAESLEEPSQTVFRSLLGHPQQPLHPVVDLIHQRQVAMPSLPLDLIHADGLDGAEILMGHAPENRMFYRLEHVSPAGVEDAGHLVPGQTLGPAGQEPAITGRQVAFPDGPRHLLHRHAAFSAVHPPHGIHEEHGDPPQRHELEPPLRQPIVTRSGRPQPEQIARPFLRACTSTSIAFRPASSTHLAFPYTKDLKGSIRLRIVFSSILWRLRVRWLVCKSIYNRKAHRMLLFSRPVRLQSFLPGEAESGSAGTQPDKE